LQGGPLFSTISALRVILALAFAAACGALQAQTPPAEYQPSVGQPGKDVVWVPTPHALVEKMLDMAQVTPQDYVVDLGSGDGRTVIAAARRGARALGVEYNPNMVELSRRAAEREGVSAMATFVQGDMYQADISQATVLPLFLLQDNLRKLAPKFLALKPGTRIVTNGFLIPGWEYVESGRTAGDCGAWCTAYLYIVPARVAGTWHLPAGRLSLEQKFQTLSGTLDDERISQGRVRGDRIAFTVNGAQYSGRVNGSTMILDKK
jgi:SAM-dependent methyltransferase